jgi:hypothetical protein
VYVVAKLGSGDSVSGVTTTAYHAVMAGGRARGWDAISLSVQRALLSLVRCLVTEAVDEPVSLYFSWRLTSTAISGKFRTWFVTVRPREMSACKRRESRSLRHKEFSPAVASCNAYYETKGLSTAGHDDSRTASASPHGPAHGDMDADLVVETLKHRHFRESSPHDCALALVDVCTVVALRLTDAALMIRRRHGLHPTNIDGLRGTIQSQGPQREAVEAVSQNKEL